VAASDTFVLSKLPASRPVAKPLASNFLPSKPRSLHLCVVILSLPTLQPLTRFLSRPPLEVSRSPIASDPERSLSARSASTKSPLSSSSGSCPSSAWFVRLPKTSRYVLFPGSAHLALTHNPLFFVDRPALPVVRRHGPAGSRRGIPRLTLRGHQLGSHPRQAGDYPAQGSGSCPKTTWYAHFPMCKRSLSLTRGPIVGERSA